MLILGREIGQSILIGNDIVVTVLSTRGMQVRIGIAAPKEVEVHREEVYERIQRERQAAKGGAQDAPKSSTLKLPPHQRR